MTAAPEASGSNATMLHPPARPAIAVLVAIATTLLANFVFAADPVRPVGQSHDWKKLDGLIEAGEYDKAETLADDIARAIKPEQRRPTFIEETISLVRALKTRGNAQIFLGKIDEAEKSLEGAYRDFRDPDFQRLLSLAMRQQSMLKMSDFVLLELNWVELLNLRMRVVLNRLRFVNLTRSAGTEGELQEQVAAWRKELTVLERQASEARKTLVASFEKGGDGVLTSPYKRSLAGDFWPSLVTGIRSLELSRLPFGDPGPAGGEPARDKPPLDKQGLVDDAVRSFDEAEAALEKAIAAASPKGAGGLRPEAKTEEGLLRAELFTNQGYALLAAGKPARAREKLTKAVDLYRQVATQRSLPQPETHPNLFWPQLLLVECLLEESRLALAGGDAAAAKAATRGAAEGLDRANDSNFPKAHPLRARMAVLEGRLKRELAAAEATMPGSDAADAAARSLRRAIDATAPAGTAF